MSEGVPGKCAATSKTDIMYGKEDHQWGLFAKRTAAGRLMIGILNVTLSQLDEQRQKKSASVVGYDNNRDAGSIK